MALLVWLLRIVLITMIIRVVFGFFSQLAAPRSRPASGPRPAARPKERAGGTLVRDPQCGTYIPETRALSAGSGTNIQYFCSEDCRRAYLAAHPAAHSA
jgi:YHS domain-containing protein